MERVSGIYRIVCTKNGRYYFGSSKNVASRWSKHKHNLRKGNHVNGLMQHVWIKHGGDSFRCELVESVEPEKLEIVEDQYLEEHVGRPNCMNIKKTAGVRLSTEQRKQLTQSLWDRSGYRENLSKKIRDKCGSIEYRKGQSQMMKEEWKKPSRRASVDAYWNVSHKDEARKRAKVNWKNADFRDAVSKGVSAAIKLHWQRRKKAQA